MIIDLRKKRTEYFADWTAREILSPVIDKEGSITIKDLQRGAENGRVIVGTKDSDLGQLLAEESMPDSLSLPEKAAKLTPNQILVLPPHYRLAQEQARDIIAYSLESMVLLDSAAVKRALLGNVIPQGPLSAKRKEQEQLSPEKVISTAFNLLHDQCEELAEKVLTGYTWWGKDHHRRIVSVYRSIQGAELRAFQDYAAFRLLIPTFRKEIRLGTNLRMKKPLTEEERAERTAKIERYEKYLARRHIGHYIHALQADFTDLIEASGGFAYRTGQTMRVPSRTQKREACYTFKLTDVPLCAPDDPRAYSQVWEIAGNDYCHDKNYRSDRRKQEPARGNREDFFCPHEIAGALTMRKKFENDPQTVRLLPFVLPTAAMMDYVDTLRYRTILLIQNPETKQWQKRPLNHTEIENLLFKKVLSDGYEACFTTDITRFKEERYDPHLDLIKFRS